MLTKEMFKRYERSPASYTSKLNFELQSINLWTLDEIFKRLDDNPDKSKTEVIGDFVKLMDEYACMARTEKSKTMYSAAKSYAEFVLDCHLSEFVFKEV